MTPKEKWAIRLSDINDKITAEKKEAELNRDNDLKYRLANLLEERDDVMEVVTDIATTEMLTEKKYME